MHNLKTMWTWSWTGGLVVNLVSIIHDYSLHNVQRFEDNIGYFG